MRKWLTLLMFALLFAFPSLAAAQDELKLASVEIKLWPEYDQPSMLVIYDFQVPEDTPLPASVSFHIPADATLNAVARLDNGEFINTEFDGPAAEGEWQVLTIPMEAPTTYRFEYYEPLSMTGSTRQFSYLWYGDYAVSSFSLSVQQPMDTTGMTTDPAFNPTPGTDGLTYYNSPSFSISLGEQFSLHLQYEKSSDRLTVPSPNIEPSAPINENTSGRVSLSNYIPYILGALAVIVVVGAVGVYFLWGKPREAATPRRRRSHASPVEEGGEVYCPQCGQRARPGDRFCRACGTRLRQPKEN